VAAEAVSPPRLDVAEHGAAERAGALRGDPLFVPVDQGEPAAGVGSGDVDLLDAAAGGDRGVSRRGEGECGQQHGE
jgi:hypothetical protein